MGTRDKQLFAKHTLADAGLAPARERPFPPAEVISRVGAIGLLLGRTVSQLVTAKVDRGESWRMAHRFTNESVTFVVVAMSFVGMIMVYQSTEQLARAVGDTQLVGASFLKLLVPR
jgi:ABC-type transporter Mla maintaining outer membrane lipid asymmetry permease subunit MlaE